MSGAETEIATSSTSRFELRPSVKFPRKRSPAGIGSVSRSSGPKTFSFRRDAWHVHEPAKYVRIRFGRRIWLAVFRGRPAAAVAVEFGGASHVGHVGESNEDDFAVIRRNRSQELLLSNLAAGVLPASKDETYCFFVADGIGGAAAGELASRVAIQKAWDLTDQASSWVMRLQDLVAQQVQERMEAFVTEMHRTFRELGEADPDLAGMGTTWT